MKTADLIPEADYLSRCFPTTGESVPGFCYRRENLHRSKANSSSRTRGLSNSSQRVLLRGLANLSARSGGERGSDGHGVVIRYTRAKSGTKHSSG